MGLSRGIPEPALIVPDEETYLVFGAGVCGSVAAQPPGAAHLLVAPERVPRELVAAVRSAWSLMPAGSTLRTYGWSLPGVETRQALADAGAPERRGGAGHGGHDHGGHDDGEMMAITGEPSADGLVMEAMDVQVGPLAVALGGGLVVRASLDGGVVAACEVRATLTAERSAPPDPWSAVAWTSAELAATERVAGVVPHAGRWLGLAAVEVERAVSHLAWLHGFCRLLGWAHMMRHARAALTAAVSARGLPAVQSTTPDLPDVSTDRISAQLRRAHAAVVDVATALRSSRAFTRRTSGLGVVSAGDVAARALSGPVARASGVAGDARADDPAYVQLRFEPVVREEGDARARALVRVDEAAQSLRLAAAAGDLATRAAGDITPRFGRPPGGLVEGARGPVRVLLGADATPQRTTPGARSAVQAAGELAGGREWAAALVTVASFDISPWRVGA